MVSCTHDLSSALHMPDHANFLTLTPFFALPHGLVNRHRTYNLVDELVGDLLEGLELALEGFLLVVQGGHRLGQGLALQQQVLGKRLLDRALLPVEPREAKQEDRVSVRAQAGDGKQEAGGERTYWASSSFSLSSEVSCSSTALRSAS